MSLARIALEQEIAASPERTWAAICDHEGMTRWLDARVTVLARGNDAGVGTVRRVRARGLVVIDEEVVYADAPEGDKPGRLVYRIVRGMPIRFHRGEMIVERGAGPGGAERSRITWDIVLASDVPGLARVSVLALGPALRAGLRKLDRLLAASR